MRARNGCRTLVKLKPDKLTDFSWAGRVGAKLLLERGRVNRLRVTARQKEQGYR